MEGRELRCTQCKEIKPESMFYRDAQKARGRRYYCKSCVREQHRKVFHTERGRVTRRNRNLKVKYGLTLSDFNRMLEKQNYQCVICGAFRPPETPTSKFWNVDHDHGTGKVRDILCFVCNLTLGVAKESIPRLQRCLAYIRFHKGKTGAPGLFQYYKPRNPLDVEAERIDKAALA